MVFVFFVQPGDMMTFDNEISIMQSVSDLKEKIKEICDINLEQQVLLINGGEPLDATKNLCSYMAGTDTNPIYLFSTNYDISKIRILENLNYNDSDLLNSLNECCSLPVSLSTVKKRAQVAQEFYNVAKKQLEFCESFVHDQYMQQQGWSAVIANLEDIVNEFKKRWEVFRKVYDEFIADKDAYNVFFQQFQEDKTVLQRIPILGTLLETQKDLEISKNSEERNTTTSQENESSSKEITLFEWISSSDSKSSLDDLCEVCRSNLYKFESEIVPSLEKQVQEAVQNAEKTEKKEIEGLNKRLFDLQELLIKIKKYVEHQSDMSQSFQQNQQRASNLRDLSILPDLCATHLKQLEYIKEHHKKLMDDRNRIVKAKFELSKSLIARIGWVQDIESWVYDLDNKLVYFHEHLQRLRKHLQVFQQLHLAPTTYLSAVTEVVRRRNFSQMFLLWASDLACSQLTIHNEEITRRKEFNAMFEGHFLKSLFPGLSDLPPSFATEAPAMFDAKLPKITEDDVERLRRELPDFADNLTLPDLTTIVQFFMAKSGGKDKDKIDDVNKAVEDKLIQAVSDVGLASNLDKNLLKGTGSESCLVTAHGLPHLKDIDKGCESETDTEEFEKVGQSPLELNFDKYPISQQSTQDAQVPVPAETIVEKQDASTSTEDDLRVSRTEHDKIKSLFLNMGSLAKQEAVQLRTELNDLKAQVLTNSTSFGQHCGSLSSSWDNIIVELDNQEKALIGKIVQDHKDEILTLKKVERSKNEQIKSLEITKAKLEEWLEENTKEKSDLEQQISDLKDDYGKNIEELNNRLLEKDAEREKCIKELSESLKLEHKAEIDSIKSRFRLMTMERSPSCSSLEKEKSGDFISLPSHNATLLAQMAENFEMDKEHAVAEERHKWEKILKEKIEEVERRCGQEKEFLQQDVAKKVSEEKEKQIDLLTEKTNNLLLECAKHKTTIQQLTEFSSEQRSAELIEQIDSLRKEKEDLQEKLNKAESENRMNASVVMSESTKTDATTSPVREIRDLSKSTIAVSNAKILNLNIDTCKPGDTVMVIWDPTHENFKILQESKDMFFLHSDCMERLGLNVVEGKPNKSYCSGEVFDKEYCRARKSENRYKVAKGTKFIRVKVKPTGLKDSSQSLYVPRFSANQPSGMSQSQSSASAFEPVSEEPSMASPPRSRLTSTQEEDLPLDSEEPRTLTNRLSSSPEKEDPHLQPHENPPETTDQTQVSTITLTPALAQTVYEEPEELRPHSVEKHFAEDSGIEQSVEALEHLEASEKKSVDDDRVPMFTVFETLLQNFE